LERINHRAKAFIDQNHILNLAVSQGDDVWAAPVFYIFYKTCFYFFSNETSRHILFSKSSGTAAASIHSNPFHQKDIKGLQLKGCIQKAGNTLVSAKAFALYLKKFSFPRDYTDPGVFGKAYNASWFVFIPELIIFMDNSIRFGYKTTIEF
jgi:hypothetical protein